LFLEVVFMRSGRRYGLSGAQKIEIWRRWKAGESLHEIGRALGKDMARFISCYRSTAGLFRLFAGAQSEP
jgi:hypothetical protein